MLQKLKRLDRNVMLCIKPYVWMGKMVLLSGVNNPPCIRLAAMSNIVELVHVQRADFAVICMHDDDLLYIALRV